MSKRKQQDESDGEPQEIVDVNFDYYNVNASNDYHAILRLLIQLFGPVDAARVQTGPLADLVVTTAAESGVGSTIKMDEDEDADAYAFLTVVGCDGQPALGPVIEYLLSKDEGFHGALSMALDGGRVGLVLGERLVNMPVQVMPPMYRMLSEELDAQETFTHYLFVSRAYRSTPADDATQRDAKRCKATTASRDSDVRGFHPEDEVIMEHATHTATYALTASDDGGEGLELFGRAMIVQADKLSAVVQKIADAYSQ